jgi:hypothetical protein
MYFIYKRKDWPIFTWDNETLLRPLAEVRNLQGKMMGRMESLGFYLRREAMLDTLTFWVDDTIVVYIGKAGKDGSSATLQSRLRQYFGFGQGKNVGHWGGRLIWQLKNSADLVVCWKALPTADPRTVEAELIQDFASKFSNRPFANLAD